MKPSKDHAAITRPTKGIVLTLVFVLAIIHSPSARALDKADLFSNSDRAKDLVALIRGGSEGGTTEGSAIVFHVEGTNIYAFTAKHVVLKRGDWIEGLTAQFLSWPEMELPTYGEYLHPVLDLASVRIDAAKLGLSTQEIARVFSFDQLGDPDSLDPGKAVNFVGHATADRWVNNERSLTFADFDRQPDGSAPTFRFEYSCPKGHSGGPVFDGDWRLVGMMLEYETPHCRALSIDQIRTWLLKRGYRSSLREDTRRREETEIAVRTIKVAVLDFDNRSTARYLSDVGYVAQDIVSSQIFNLEGVQLLTRDRLGALQTEIHRTGTVGSTAGLSRLGKLHDVDAIVTGSVIRYDVENQVVNAYGTNARIDTYRMDISLQILDVDSGRVRFSKTYDVEDIRHYPRADSAPRRPVDRTTELLQRLLDQANEDLQRALTEITSGLQTAGKRIAVPIDSVPSGAEVLINDVYKGTTPLELELSFGLQEIEIRYPGHQDWIRRVEIKPGEEVKAILIKR